MASNSDDFDDFFDTSDPTAHDSNKPDQSRRKVSASSEREQSTDYSSDRDSRDRHSSHRQRNGRSRSASSRSRDSSFSDDSSRSRSPRRKGNRHSDSRSRSSGTDGSRSRTASSDSRTGEEEAVSRKAKVNRRRDRSLSADAVERDKRHTKSGSRDAARGEAWGTETKSRKSKQRDGSDSNSSADRKSRQRRKDRHRSRSDSDITDVSPISSPRNDQREHGNKCDAKPPKCSTRAPGVRGDSRSRDGGGDKSALELNLLMNAVSELEKQTRVQANTRTVMFEPGQIRRERKSNYTFSDSDTNRIEQENQRLLRKLMCRMHSVDGRYTGSTGKGRKSVMAASGINRLKDHHRIEKENLALLKRLHQIKPSTGISREEQLSAYHTTLLHGVPISSTQCPTPVSVGHCKSGGTSRAGSEAGSLGRTRSLMSVQSAATTVSSVRSGQSRRLRSRPSSAKSSVRERPPWDDRW